MIRRRENGALAVRPSSEMGAPALSESDILVSMRDTYVETASSSSAVMEEASRAFSSYFESYRDYKAKVGKVIRGNIQTRMVQFGLSPFAVVGAITEAMKLASKVESESHALENTKRIYIAASDTLKNVGASWEMWKNLRFSHLVDAGLIGEKSVNALAAYLGQSSGWTKGAFVLNVASLWASKKGVSWSNEIMPAGERIVSSERRLWSDLLDIGKTLKIPESQKVGTSQWNSERAGLVSEYRAAFLAASKKAYDAALKGKREPGMVETVFNWIVETSKDLLNLALFSIAGLPGILLHFSGFRLVQFQDLSKSAYAAARILPAALEVLSRGAAEFSATYKSVRIDQKKSDAQAAAVAVEAGKKEIEKAGKPAFSSALKDIDDYMNHYKRASEALDRFLSGLKDILWKILLYGGIAVGALGVGYLLLRNVLPGPTIKVVSR